MLNEEANIYPATKAGLELPVLQEGVEFYGGQADLRRLRRGVRRRSPRLRVGPDDDADLQRRLRRLQGAPSTGQGTLLEALEAAQASTIEALKAQSIPVKRVTR